MNSNLANLPTIMDYGQVTMVGTGETIRQEFNFNKSFPQTPKILLSIQRYSTTNFFDATVVLTSADTNSFYIAFKATNGLSYNIHWLAVY